MKSHRKRMPKSGRLSKPTVELPEMTEHERRLFKALRALRRAEWMVTHDWGGERDRVMREVDRALLQTANAFGIKPTKNDVWRPDEV